MKFGIKKLETNTQILYIIYYYCTANIIFR